ncbi:MAG: radical SAM protein [Planctomycetes bacterium]|nr:radical SAM protein [Planctomycetota bacterium]
MVDPASYALFRRRAVGLAPAAFVLARAARTDLTRGELASLPEGDLFRRHAEAMEGYRAALARDEGRALAATTPPAGEASLLDLKVELATRLLAPCRLCHLRCPVDRLAGETGRCGLGAGLRVYRDIVHLGEELELVPTHTLWLSGCNWRCAYCSDWAHVERPETDPEVALERVARSIDARRAEGARSLTFVGGLPDVNLPGIARVLALTRASVPVVWNSNMSATPEAHDLLEGLVCAYVADLKYGSERCARAGSAVPASLEVVHDNLRRVRAEAWLIVRHLVLPGHVDCCALPALDWLAAHLPGARVNVMGQYEPLPEVRGTAWDRRVTADEVARAREHARALGLDLEGPGPLPPPDAGTPDGDERAASPAVAFESTIRIGSDGRVVFEDLPPDLAALAADLAGDDDPDLSARRRAARPWAGDPGPAGGG